MKRIKIILVLIPISYAIFFCFFKPEINFSFPEKDVTVVGVVDAYPEKRISSNRYTIKILEYSGYKITETARIIWVTNPYTNYNYGDKFILTGQIEKPENFITDTGKTFDYESYLKLSKVYGILREGESKQVDGFYGSVIKSKIFKIRSIFSGLIDKHLNFESSILTKGVLLGEKNTLPTELRENLSKTNTSHIIAVSGYNVSIVSEFIMKALSGQSLFVKGVFGILGIIFFLIFVGGGNSVLRAGVMGIVIIYSRMIGKSYNSLYALLFATSLLVLINPLALRYDVGFHLSILATFGLITYQKTFSKIFKEKLKVKGFLNEILSSSVSATIMTMPYVAYQIGIMSIVGLFVNIIITPLIPLVMMMGFVSAILGIFLDVLGNFSGFGGNIISGFVLGIINFFGELKFSAIITNSINVWFIIVIYVFLFYFGLKEFKKS